MPISRYEIRNEYSLADPDLYRAADKDDPEALLEGVAMAGLVGVLRQLGDLAEFAAEIFHNLHEEVMATAARGHGLMIRVQQLETEVPSIERAFLSQTDHSSFFYHPGSSVHWRPHLQIDQNLITRGNLPRFVMDSYEECRAPPRLFLLDKFDVAGAGSCLKRYTDPSFFKVETSVMTNADVPREKKIRKAKKKGPRWKNGETTEVLPTSHTKLHQLLLEEERIESGVRNPIRRAKLKRELNGFPFNSKTGQSYMEKLLMYPSPDHKVVHEVTVNSSMSATFENNESGLEIGEVRPVSTDRENVGRKRGPSSPDREEIVVNSSIYESSEVAIDDKICEVRNLYPIATVGGISSDLDMTGEKVIDMDAESSREDTLIGYQSDDIVSEVDNYVDATSTMESDTDADSRLRMQSDFISSHIKIEPLISDANEEILQTGSFDSQSIGDSIISDEGNNSSRKEMSIFSSDSPSTSAENPQSERISTKGFSEPVVIDDTCPNKVAITNHTSDYEQVTSNLCSSESIPTLVCSDSGVAGKDMLDGPLWDKMDLTLHDEEKKSNLVMDPPCSSCVYDSDFHSGDELNGESIPSVSNVIHYHTEDSSDKVTSDLVHGNESDHEDQYSVENIAFTFNSFHSLNENGAPKEMNASKNLIPGKLDDENLSNDFIVQNGDNVESMVSKEENLIVGLDNEDSGVSTDSPNQFPCFMETFLQKKLEETSSANTHSVDAEDNHSNNSIENQIFPEENFVLSHLINSSDWPQAGMDASDGDVIPEEDTTLNETCALGTPESCEVLGLLGTGITHHGSSSASGELEAVTEMDGTSNGQEVTEILGSAEVKLPDEVHILLDEPDSGEDNLYTATVPELSNLIIDDIPSPVGRNKLVEEHINFFEDLHELENGKNSLSGSHGELSLAEKLDQTKAAKTGSGTVLCNTDDNDNPKLEVSGAVPNTHRDLEDDQDLQLVHPEIIQPPIARSLLYREHEYEESVVQKETGSLPDQFDKVLLHSSEITSEVSPVLPIDHHKMPDDDDLKGDNYTELRRLINFDIDVSRDQFDSILPPSNPFSKTNQINLSDPPPLPPLPPVQWMTGKLQHASSSTEGEMMKHEELFPQLNSRPVVSTDDARYSPSWIDEMKHSPGQVANKPASKEEKIESPRVEVNAVHETVDLPPSSEIKLKQIVIPISESEFTSPAEEDGNANGSRTGKSPRPRHPLIDEFAALDKSKLRKVTERVRPGIHKVEERDSLLEQIRTKSFNLRPALASRPSIRGPNTNLKVAAIVERANAIRQALAGSDEDDDDSWSDS